MTHMNPASEKLRERGLRIVMTLGGLDRDAAAKLLGECEGNLAEATRALQLRGR
jgi:N-acetylmuramic acid 6-phosphate (MurNAc-6-P) etherase